MPIHSDYNQTLCSTNLLTERNLFDMYNVQFIEWTQVKCSSIKTDAHSKTCQPMIEPILLSENLNVAVSCCPQNLANEQEGKSLKRWF